MFKADFVANDTREDLYFLPPEIAIVAPTFNERDNVIALKNLIADALKGRAWELIFVDDGSRDRTRELLRRYKTMPIPELLDLSVNSTLSRTAMTATTTILSLLALVIFGGTAIEGFALVMLFGVFVCTYSAMFVSTPVLLYFDVRSGARADQGEEVAVAKSRV